MIAEATEDAETIIIAETAERIPENTVSAVPAAKAETEIRVMAATIGAAADSEKRAVLRAEENDENEDTYYLIIHDKIRHKPALLIFSPNETTLEKLRPFLSVELKKKFMSIHPFTQK